MQRPGVRLPGVVRGVANRRPSFPLLIVTVGFGKHGSSGTVRGRSRSLCSTPRIELSYPLLLSRTGTAKGSRREHMSANSSVPKGSGIQTQVHSHTKTLRFFFAASFLSYNGEHVRKNAVFRVAAAALLRQARGPDDATRVWEMWMDQPCLS